MNNHKILLALGLNCVAAYVDLPLGLMGGTTSSSDGQLAPVSGLPTSAQINAVAINMPRIGFIGYPFCIRFAYVSEFPAGKFEEFICLI